MVPVIEAEIFKLKLAEVSKPVEVEDGIYIFKAIGISPGKVDSLDDVKDKVTAKLYDAEFDKKFKEWILKLRKKTYIEIK